MRVGSGLRIMRMELRSHRPISAPLLLGATVVIEADGAAIPALPGVKAQQRSDSILPETYPPTPAQVRTTTLTTLHGGILWVEITNWGPVLRCSETSVQAGRRTREPSTQHGRSAAWVFQDFDKSTQTRCSTQATQ